MQNKEKRFRCTGHADIFMTNNVLEFDCLYTWWGFKWRVLNEIHVLTTVKYSIVSNLAQVFVSVLLRTVKTIQNTSWDRLGGQGRLIEATV